MKTSSHLQQAARLLTRQGLRIKQKHDLYQIFQNAAIANYDEFLRVIATIGEKYGVIVRPYHAPLPNADIGPPVWVSDIIPTLRSRQTPEAFLAVELLPYLTPSGLLLESDEVLAREIGAAIPDVRAARQLLIRCFELGYRSIIHYWLETAGNELSQLDQTVLSILESNLKEGIHEPERIARSLENQGYAFSYLKRLVTRLTRRFGHGPRTPEVHMPERRRKTVDIVLFRSGDTLNARYNLPRMNLPGEHAVTATLTIDPDIRRDIVHLIRRCLETRRRALKTMTRLILEFNTPYLLGYTLYRRNVPYAYLRQHYPGDPKETYNLIVEFESQQYYLHELLGYDRHPRSGYVIHAPLRDISALRQRYPDLSVKEFRKYLAHYGIHVPRSTLHRLLQENVASPQPAKKS